MPTTHDRPGYISFVTWGPPDDVDHLGARPDEVMHVSSNTRYDLMPADDLGFTNKAFLDRGYDPESAAYKYTAIKPLDELNARRAMTCCEPRRTQ
ncbi:hypothetical protein [Phycicoccus sp. Soil803]|uniref:hypothetical protein n=1 Tax=Phycicoccus sp. Soil803 TaxID=1736415 RepID=UPI00070C464B|nr:hypothetical protein [Phycicoccus sp. Soil803]KRF26046.1 hypothetical protein ASG95_17425 [Phycicoccus sp. Soil803]